MSQSNPLKQVSITLALNNGIVSIGIGSNTYQVPLSILQDIWRDRSESILRDYLYCQAMLVLQQAGVDPTTATPSQIATAIQAQQYWV